MEDYKAYQKTEAIQYPSYIDIDLNNLEHNYQHVKNLVGQVHVMPIVKANAYGHGMIKCAKQLEKCGVHSLGVAILQEGIALRQAGICIPIVVLGGILHCQIDQFLHYDLAINAASIDKLLAIEQRAKELQKRAHVHLEIDTGIEFTQAFNTVTFNSLPSYRGAYP